MNWINPNEHKPPTFLSVLAFGILGDEEEPDTHEGYWDGMQWKSVRCHDPSLKLKSVTHRARIPKPYDPEQ